MLKLSAMLMLSAAAAIAGPTTIAQSKITSGNGQQLATGKITITASAPFLAADGTWVDTTPLTVPVINGAFSTQLEPTDTATPSGVSYLAKWQLDGAAPRTDNWLVITSSSALNLAGVRVNVAPSVSLMFSPGQFIQDGAAIGQALCWMGSTWGPGSCGGGLNSCLQIVSWSPSPTFDFSVCRQQVITLTGNVTPTIANAGFCQVAGGCTIGFIQGSTPYTVTWASSVTGGFQVGTVAGKRNVQIFTSLDGANLVATSVGVVNQ